MKSKNNAFYGDLLQNVVAGLTVSFVALTLGAAFGLLSGRGAFAGMLSAGLIALITSLFGGTKIQCSGPTGPMTTVTALIVGLAHDKIVTQFPGLSADHFINLVILLSGLMLVLMAVFRLGKYVTLVPNVVISGFMNGIAIIILLDQIKRIFGLAGKTAFTGSLAINIGVTVLSAALVFILPLFLKKYLSKYASLLSATLLAIVIMTFFSNLFGLDIEHVQLTASINSWHDFTNLIVSQWPSNWELPVILIALPFALQLSVLCYLDTLMTSLIVDKMVKTKTKQDKELFAQGLASLAVSFVGGIPGAQATIRSVLIIKEKATWRLAGVLVGIFALLEMILFQGLINLIPQAVFSGILIKVAYDVFDFTPVRLYVKEWIKSRSMMLHHFFSRHDDERIFVTNREFIMIAGTTLVTIIFDLNLAVAVFTVLFYLHNRFLFKKNPMRDLKPFVESESLSEEL